jgi:hypothetical protein
MRSHARFAVLLRRRTLPHVAGRSRSRIPRGEEMSESKGAAGGGDKWCRARYVPIADISRHCLCLVRPRLIREGRSPWCVANDCIPREHAISVRERCWFISPHWDRKPGLIHAT